MRILILGANGMLGHTLIRYFSQDPHFEVFGTIRGQLSHSGIDMKLHKSIIPNIDVQCDSSLKILFKQIKPNLVINCIGIVKQFSDSENPLNAIPINSLLPHKIADICSDLSARLIHVSTDCVFSGNKGNYSENDSADCFDLYGRSKLLGEIYNKSNVLTLRTSIIGYEINHYRGLLSWFLSQKKQVNGYRQAIFSGLPTVEVASVISQYVIPNNQLYGLYHLSSEPISKYELLKIIAIQFKMNIEIIPDDELIIDRSLNSKKFRTDTGYEPKSWNEMIKLMYDFG